jgi:integrase
VASIIQVKGRWRVQIRRKGAKTQTKTFDTKAQAERWAKGQEVPHKEGKTLAEVIQAYRELRVKAKRPVDDTSSEHYTLNTLSDRLGHLLVDRMVAKDLVDFASARLEECSPTTINMDISKLGTVMRHVSALEQTPCNDVVGAARPLLNHLGLVATGGQRTRRPTTDELERLFGYFRDHAAETYLRMEDIVTAALTLGLRRGELFRVLWSDVDSTKKMILVRDRKHPRQKKGNDQWIPLIGVAWELVQRQPKTTDLRVFPFHPATVSKYFKKACDVLSIQDLHFHDMRREAASVLLELGWHDRQVKMITGHSSKVFEVYARPDPSKLHELPAPARKAST